MLAARFGCRGTHMYLQIPGPSWKVTDSSATCTPSAIGAAGLGTGPEEIWGMMDDASSTMSNTSPPRNASCRAASEGLHGSRPSNNNL
eukprot:5958418-Alexandrium_andersonii.AAC.1